MESAHDYIKFRKNCLEAPELIKLYSNVLPDAEKYFKIKHKSDLLSIIGNNELEKLEFKKTTTHDKNSDIKIDIYWFQLNKFNGYLAFFYFKGSWTIKSFHNNNIEIEEPIHSQKMHEALKQLGLPKNYTIRRA